jgi:hypothetical protein
MLAPNRIESGGLLSVTFTWKVRVAGIGDRRDLAHDAISRDAGVG